jgi:hypothetical protein
MVYQLETRIARRKVLKGSGLAALCSVLVPLRSFADIVRSNEREVEAECSICQLVHGNGNCSNDQL